jgi:peptidoglycan-associated lipoprotein
MAALKGQKQTFRFTMKNYFLLPILTAALFTGCTRSGQQVWTDTKSAARQIGRGFKTLWGNKDDAGKYAANEEFFTVTDDFSVIDEAEEGIVVDSIPQPKASPGEAGGAVPGIDSFVQPTGSLAQIFKHIHFDCDSNRVLGAQNQSSLKKIAQYLKDNPHTYLFIEGHCDERGAADYNLALGTRRANAVREKLVSLGVSSEHLFSTSYGWERPMRIGHTESAWKLNRRVEFKLFAR